VVCDEIGKITGIIHEEELARAKAQLKASILMSLESTSSRAEQLARQLMIFGRTIPTEESVAKIDAVNEAAIQAVAKRIFATEPTLAALGPIDGVEDFETVKARLN
jgi:predicted Zn-dependent peptidase